MDIVINFLKININAIILIFHFVTTSFYIFFALGIAGWFLKLDVDYEVECIVDDKRQLL